MIPFGRSADLASALAKHHVQSAAKTAGKKAALMIIGSILLGIALVFGAIAAYIGLSVELGPIWAAAIIALVALLGGAVVMLWALRPTPSRGPKVSDEMAMVAEQAKRDAAEITPLMVAGAFVTGFFSGRK